VWERLLGSILANPRSVAGSAPEVRRGLGLFARLPGTARGAVAARSATYWRRDPRMAFPAVMSTIVPLGLVVVWKATGSEPALLAMPAVSGFLIGWGPHNDVGYDSTAFWLHVASGVDGLSDRLGRLFPSAVQAAVAVPVYSLLGAGLSHRWDLLPAMSGAALGVLLCGFAVASVVSAVKQYPVPGPGDSPFATPPGGAGITLLVQLGCSLAVVVLSAPVLLLAALGLAGHSWAAWAALGVGPLVGGAVLALALRLGSGLFDRRGALLLQDLVRVR
jgi:ABC-2 type transport system permease protein